MLEHAGLITRRREAQSRPCRLEAVAFKDATDWLERYRQYWESSLDRLDDHLRKIQKGNRK